MTKLSRSLLVVLLCTTWITVLLGQSRTKLEQERDRLIEQLEIADQQLAAAESNTKSSLSELSAISTQIKSRENLIANLQSQLDLGLSGIRVNTDSIAKMDEQLANLKVDFGKVVRLSHLKTRSQNPWLSIFSANSLNEVILTFQYTNQFDKYLSRKEDAISHLKSAIDNKIKTIKEEQEYTEKLIDSEKVNFAKLASAKDKKNELILDLKKDEKKLRRERDQKRKEREKLNSQIEKIIVAELQKRSEERRTTSSVSTTTKHSLRWPVQNGYISSKFGQQPHPTISSLKVNNNGIDISTKAASQVFTVLEGTVVGVTNIPGYDTMIIIEHGEHYTVYSKLAAANVTKGDKVALGQKVGELGKSGNLHFEIWKGKQKLDPQKWLKKQ